MNTLILIGADIVGVLLLACLLYFRRHRRRDLMVSYLGVNVGVLAVAAALTGSSAGLGLGLGLFGVLSIIRLRSTELSQHEVAYYFAALALGLIGGIGVAPIWLGMALMALIVVSLWIGDHPSVLPRYRLQQVVLDRAIGNDSELTAELQRLLGGKVHSFTVQLLDMVNDKTTVEVRFKVPLAVDSPDIAGSAGRDAASSTPSPSRGRGPSSSWRQFPEPLPVSGAPGGSSLGANRRAPLDDPARS